MTTTRSSGQVRNLAPGRLQRLLSRIIPREYRVLAMLMLLTLLLAILIGVAPEIVPLMTMVVPIVIASLVLGPKHLPWFVVYALLATAVLAPMQPQLTVRIAVTVAVMFSLGFIVLLLSFGRSSLGVAGLTGESMLVDLRDRILRQGVLPKVPDDWYVASALRSAGGTPFAGDFTVCLIQGPCLNLVVVDVSGKGASAGTRALQLSGAFGSLLGAVAPEDFLATANDYLVRQDWHEGFATAVHLHVDLSNGDYAVRAAGHPPPVVRRAGSGRWETLSPGGPVLGLLADIDYPAATGTLLRGDAMMLYTDGMIEGIDHDIDDGIDRMIGHTESLLRGSFEGAVDTLVDSIGSRNDDRALVVLQRRAF